MKKYEGKSIRKGKTDTGKIPDSVGFDGRGGGYIDPVVSRASEMISLGKNGLAINRVVNRYTDGQLSEAEALTALNTGYYG